MKQCGRTPRKIPKARITVVVDASFEHRIAGVRARAGPRRHADGEIVSPPAGAIGRGDAFVLRIAERTGAIVLSNDSFPGFHGEHPWLFDEGRLIGGKPVPGVGWIFTPRLPVRGVKSRAATAEARVKEDPESAPAKAAELAKAAKKAAKRSPKKEGTPRRHHWPLEPSEPPAGPPRGEKRHPRSTLICRRPLTRPWPRRSILPKPRRPQGPGQEEGCGHRSASPAPKKVKASKKEATKKKATKKVAAVKEKPAAEGGGQSADVEEGHGRSWRGAPAPGKHRRARHRRSTSRCPSSISWPPTRSAAPLRERSSSFTSHGAMGRRGSARRRKSALLQSP